jgi:lipid-binding SYLF domain-containing protein
MKPSNLLTILSFSIACAAALSPGAASAASLDADATAALNSLYKRYPSAATLSKDAKAILVFPKITKAGLMVGGETGDGVMRVKGRTVGYYNTSGVSYGLQVGAQQYGYALFLMTDKAVKSIGAAEGFEVGVGPSVVVMDDALASKTTTTTVKNDIYAFIFGQKGLMAGAGIQGSKITKLKK